MSKKLSPVGELGNRKSRQFNDISICAQRQRLLAWLKSRSVDRYEAERELNIVSLAPRIFELRQRGYQIATTMLTVFDSYNRKHRIGRYTLQSGGEK